MNLHQIINALGASGGDWVLWVLVACSILSIAVIVDRAFYFVMNRESADLIGRGIDYLARGDRAAANSLGNGPIGRLFQAATASWPLGPERMRAALSAHRLRERAVAERGLILLGTLGNNAPFIGLFGTVLGIIRAFHDLGLANSQGPAAVMTGISEALVATAVGILVAIPAVIAYNLCQRHIRIMGYRLEEAIAAISALAMADTAPTALKADHAIR
ncbi:MAG: MotA/TolQ/ExbB proton channel family protein [Cyanobacteria bacterium NC_groundwater_1444_Ag_S-0.65um_54_12]|nr:MotA/TolQ/ExbB proton channel family protein [Cyanobacteria bacterium NC_groundwater_1444_Ag_S-0.65um_54_12]